MIARDEAIRLLEEQHAGGRRRCSPSSTTTRSRSAGRWAAASGRPRTSPRTSGLWEEFALATIDEFGRGERPAFERRSESQTGDQLNDEGVERFLHASTPDVMTRFDDLHRRLISAIGSTSDDVWSAEYPFDPDDATLGERIGSLLGSDEGGGFTHASAHLDDLRAYVATKR
mgnify:CR=1 FL=1